MAIFEWFAVSTYDNIESWPPFAWQLAQACIVLYTAQELTKGHYVRTSLSKTYITIDNWLLPQKEADNEIEETGTLCSRLHFYNHWYMRAVNEDIGSWSLTLIPTLTLQVSSNHTWFLSKRILHPWKFACTQGIWDNDIWTDHSCSVSSERSRIQKNQVDTS